MPVNIRFELWIGAIIKRDMLSAYRERKVCILNYDCKCYVYCEYNTSSRLSKRNGEKEEEEKT